jgi:uncharacterized membrane protein YhaH (DUF805 family)
MFWYTRMWQNYTNFGGRANRKEYWYAILLQFLFLIIIQVAAALAQNLNVPILQLLVSVIGLIFVLASLIPTLAIAFRRLHDTGRSAWWLLISLIPLVGGLVLLVFLLLAGEPGENRFGPVPQPAVA